ncbi:MAG: sulfite exporter TauE/SafE family protein [Ruminobacter sp.]|jgi:uncharacterized membrane protein YfcA|uniref:Probable membrane transporter protein n=1 Tax=Ruminobacter amylophilus TaxID=867 RepID=A0A662ZH19_9GAMM|nr:MULTISPECIES: sulfite exporter TauE/SafE family protein [Ruminobacter]MBQ3776266.1 sulfite exporter TauE/SafE family protein [Ruminobacter sp.]SFP17648.1 Uncharacterized membrane protein YfcA [Ruminobacter amylophilus]
MSSIEPYQLLQIFLIFCVSGTFAGTLAGLLGIGGGIIFVPVYHYSFIYFFNMDPGDAIITATTTSLFTMIPTSLSSCLSHLRRNNIDKQLFIRWLPFMIVGVLLGTVFARLYGGLWLSTLFGCILLFAAVNMIILSKLPPRFENLPKPPLQYCMPTAIACLSSMLGIGGGTLTVPTLSLFKYDTVKAIGTAAAIGTVICIPGALFILVREIIYPVEIANSPALTLGHIAFLAVLVVLPFSMLMAPVGVAINKRMSQSSLKLLYAALLIFTGIKMLLNGLGI